MKTQHDGNFERMELGGSRWGNIYKRRPGRDLGLEGDLFVPLCQASAVAIAAGALVLAVGWPLVGRWSCYPAAVTMAATWAWSMGQGFAWVRWFSLHEEEYTSETETVAAASSEQSSVTIHTVENSTLPNAVSIGGRMVIEQLQTDRDTLALVCQSEELSKRRLTESGIDADVAMFVMRQLLEYGFIRRERQNAPASWTSKGHALRRAFAGGGGGGGWSDQQKTNVLEG